MWSAELPTTEIHTGVIMIANFHYETPQNNFAEVFQLKYIIKYNLP